MKTCKACKNRFTPQANKPFQTWCSYECALIISAMNRRKQRNKQEAEKVKEWRKEKRVLQEKLKTLSDYEKEAKKVFQEFIRLRDKDLPCISCGKSNCPDWAGGHYFAAGMYSGMIFNEDNCHKQCNSHCNKFLSGNLLEYRRGLIERYGIDFVERIEMQANEKRAYKYSKDELQKIKEYYKNKVKELK